MSVYPSAQYVWVQETIDVPATNYVEVGIANVPRDGKIKRVRASLGAGGSATTVDLYIGEQASASGMTKVLEYTDQPLVLDMDSEEDIYYALRTISTSNPNFGTLYIGVRLDAGSDQTVTVRIDIEVVK